MIENIALDRNIQISFDLHQGGPTKMNDVGNSWIDIGAGSPAEAAVFPARSF